MFASLSAADCDYLEGPTNDRPMSRRPFQYRLPPLKPPFRFYRAFDGVPTFDTCAAQDLFAAGKSGMR